MNGMIYGVDGVSSTLTTNKGEGIKIAGRLDMKGTDQLKRVYLTGGVSPCLTTMQGGHQEPKILQRIFPDPLIVASRGRNVTNPSSRVAGEDVEQRLEVNHSGTSNTITTVQKDNYVLVPSATKCGYEIAEHGDCINLAMPKSKTRRGRVGKGVSQTLDTSCSIGILFLFDAFWWVRKLTPRECMRLQDFPDTFEIVVTNAQAYKQAGNSMSVNMLEMIFRQIEKAQSGIVPAGKLF